MIRFLLLVFLGSLQLAAFPQSFTHADSLHGTLTPLRSCFDVTRYDITLRVEPARKFITGKNEISFTATQDFSRMQLDFFSSMQLDSLLFEGKPLSYTKDTNAFFPAFPRLIRKGEKVKVTAWFSGIPPEAKNAPWDGGFVWNYDKNGQYFVGLACEGLGAYSWLPCKDHLSDEAESVSMHLQVPPPLTGVSNGRLKGMSELSDGFRQFDWEVTYPINNYDITVNIADYEHFADTFYSPQRGPLSLDYYVLRDNLDQAKEHFQQVKPMLACFETHFGPYPFHNDGYKLTESPYWGMEHQSNVAYGNNYKNNSWGFDFIIIHESGHEWFGNSLSMNDPAEMWIHESFTTYTETVYMECLHGRDTAFAYLSSQRKNIQNKEPVIGPAGVYYHGRTDNDIYYKGAWMLQTMRAVLNNDVLWFHALRELSTRYARRNVTTADVLVVFNQLTGVNWEPYFQQYLYHTSIPEFQYRFRKVKGQWFMDYRLRADVPGLRLPLRVTTAENVYTEVWATDELQTLALQLKPKKVKVEGEKVLVRRVEVEFKK